MHILVVEDEQDLRDLIVHHLEQADHKVDAAISADEAWIKIRARNPEIILLDLNLPGRDGLTVLQQIRARPEQQQQTGVIIVSARNQERDILAGLEQGADDYICKPFSTAELLARVTSLSRRLGPSISVVHDSSDQAFYRAGRFVLDESAHCIRVADRELYTLSPTEFALLSLLIRRSGRLITRDEIVSEVWSEDKLVNSRTVDANVTRIRQKVGEYGTSILSVRGLGYRLVTE